MSDRLGQGAVSEPEPTDEEMRRDKLQAEYEEQKRQEVVRAMEVYDQLARDALSESEADRLKSTVYEALNGRAA